MAVLSCILVFVVAFLLIPPPVTVAYENSQLSLVTGLKINDTGITTRLDAGITYPPELVTDKQKLLAVYALTEQMRIEHNRVGKIAESNWKEYQGKWLEYSRIFKAKQLYLFREQIDLENKIIDDNYTEKDWEALTIDEKESTKLTLIGDRTDEKVKPTLATSDVLDKLKTIDFYSLNGTYVDPPENYTTYTPYDTESIATVNATSIVIDNATEDECRFVKDAGGGHFGDFEHFLDEVWFAPLTEAYNYLGFWAVADQNGYWDDITAGMMVYRYSGERFYFTDPGDGSTYMEVTEEVTYWLTITRDGETGTLYCYDTARETSLHDDIAIGVKNDTYQYLIMGYTHSSGTYSLGEWSMGVLDLQESAEPSAAVSPSSKAFGVIKSSYTHWSKGAEPSWPLTDGDAFFYLYNDGGVSLDITANATNPVGGSGATLVGGVPGAEEIRVCLLKEGDNLSDNLTLTTTQQSWMSNIATSANVSWEIRLETGSTTENPPTGKTFHVYILVTAS